MSFKNAAVFAMSLTAMLSSCTSRSKQAIQVPPPAAVQPAVVGNSADVPIPLPSEADLKKYGDTANMSYKLSYLTFSEQKTIKFEAGAAQIQAHGLPTGQTGTVSLDIYDGAVVKLHAEQANVMLTAGVNGGIRLALAPPTGGSGSINGNGSNGTTDLSIDVTLDNGNTSGTGSVVPGGGIGNGAGSSQGTGGAVDPIAGWDGKSFLGNAKWNIVPVNG